MLLSQTAPARLHSCTQIRTTDEAVAILRTRASAPDAVRQIARSAARPRRALRAGCRCQRAACHASSPPPFLYAAQRQRLSPDISRSAARQPSRVDILDAAPAVLPASIARVLNAAIRDAATFLPARAAAAALMMIQPADGAPATTAPADMSRTPINAEMFVVRASIRVHSATLVSPEFRSVHGVDAARREARRTSPCCA